MKRFLILILLISALGANAQISVSVDADRDSLLFGDEVQLQYKINLPEGAVIESLDFSALNEMTNLMYQMDTTRMEETIDFEITTSDGFPITNEQLIIQPIAGQLIPTQGIIKGRVLSVGAFVLPIPKIKTNKTYPNLPLERKMVVILPNGQPDTINANRDIIREKSSWLDYWPIALGVLGALAIVIGGVLFSRRMTSKRGFEDSAKRQVLRPAHEVAREQLSELEEQQLWQNGREKDYHTELTKIMRQYIERRYEISAMEMTTSQLLRAMASQSVESSISGRFTEILQIADKVKFAKGVTGPQINERFMADARQLIEDTQLIPTEDEAEV